MRVRLAIIFVLLFLLSAVPADARCRPYLDYGRIGPIAGHGPPYVATFDAHGIPIVQYSFGVYRNPSTVAQWGLQEHTLACLRRGNVRRHRAAALRAARWLANVQTDQGGWIYGFEFQEAPAITLHPPWISALAQGEAISLLARVYDETGRRRFLRAARHVLNGYELALIGLHDLAPRSRLARRLFADGVDSLVWAIPEFDGGPTGSYYAAGHFYPVNDPYLAVHVLLTRELYRITRRPILRRYAKRWAAALRSHSS